jgi:hypothetical protein
VSENSLQMPEQPNGNALETSIFERLGCKMASYSFNLLRDSVDLDAFYAAGRISESERNRWGGSCAPKDQASGYHIHFSGSAREKRVRMTVEYIEGSISARPDEAEPFAENFMNWLGTFIRNPSAHATVFGAFAKSNARWRSRFNLPFKVTLSGLDTEVVIDGISLMLPENASGAKHGWLTRSDKELLANVRLERRITLKDFKLSDELAAIHECIRMFVEEITV